MEPLVSVCCITYNHEKYIREAIEGFLMQKTTFPIEIIIHDDASTDKTADIIREYEKKHPDIIKPIYQTENQWSKGIKPSPTYVWPKAKGKYIALCEGDDYWTDPLKLQKQVDFLEKNEDFSVCFTNVKSYFEDSKTYSEAKHFSKDIYTITDIFNHNIIPTNTCIFRKKNFSPVPEILKKVYLVDWVLHLISAQYGKLKLLNTVTGVYRVHPTGQWSSIGVLNGLYHTKNTLDEIEKYFSPLYKKQIRGKVTQIFYSLAIFNAKQKNFRNAYVFAGKHLLKGYNIFKFCQLFARIHFLFLGH